MVRIALSLALCFSCPCLFAQADDPIPDSPPRPLPKGATARQEAERLDKIIWELFIDANVQYGDHARQLDSLYRCCILGKTKDPYFEKTLGAKAAFYLGASLVEEHPEAAQPLLKEAIRQHASLGDSAGMALGFAQLTYTATRLGDSLSFAAYLNQAVAMAAHINDPFLKSVTLSDVGINCYDFGRFAEAAAYYFQSLELVEKYRTPALLDMQHDIYHNLNGIYNRLGDWDNALNYMQKAIQCANERGQDPSVHCVGLANSYIGKKEYQRALEVLLEAEKKLKGDEISLVEASINYSLSNCYRNLGDPKAALACAEKSVRLLPISINAPFGAVAVEELAHCQFALGKTDEALGYALLAYETYLSAKQNGGLVRATELLSNIYKKKGNYRKALEYSELRYKYQTLVERQQSTRQLAFGEFNRENEVKNARREAEVQAQLTQQRNIRYALFAGLVVLALLAFLLYNRFRFKQKTAEQLEAKNREVEAAKERAERSEAFKSRFLANMSHEIRTPLHGISGYTDLLMETSLSEKQRRYLSSVRHSNERLTEVVNDILDISKLEAGGISLRRVAFSPERIAHDVLDALAPRAEANGISLTTQIGEGVPAAVLGDPTRLFQILMNLAGNAVKFTEQGGVEVAIVHESPESLLFKVTDSGIGIPRERLGAIFDSFQQADGDTTARFGGTGLGLTIARELVQLHGSDIRVESELGKGSVFSFSIAFALADAHDLQLPERNSDNLYFDQPLHVLLADDNAFNREIASEALLRHFGNASVTEAVNGREATERIAEQDFDLVLMDMQMPEMNGLEATRHIRSQLPAEKSSIPIIALTASATLEEIEAALAAGMNRHLAKPFKPHELARAIALTLDIKHTDIKPASPPDTEPASTSVIRQYALPYDLTYLSDFCDGDLEQVQAFLSKFEQQLPIELKKLEEAIVAEDRGLVYRTAHSFRPQLEFVGLREAAGLVGSIEKGARADLSSRELSALLVQVKSALQLLVIPVK